MGDSEEDTGMKWIKWYGVAMVVSSITLFCLFLFFLFAGWHDDMAYLFFGTMATAYSAFLALTGDWS